jgi:hypothetical protein
MYIVTLENGTIATEIHNANEKLLSGTITQGINVIDSFQFEIHPSNVGFNKIKDYTTLVSVYNTNKSRYEFYGRVLCSDDEMDSSGKITKAVVCESYMGFLCDSVQDYVAERNWTVRGLLEHIIDTHNGMVESYKQFKIGTVDVEAPNDNLYLGIQRENTWETLKKNLIDTLGGELRFRVVGTMIFIDYCKAFGSKKTTKITVSRNMKSIVKERDPSEIITRLVPLGCKLKATDDEGKEVETEYRLDISSVNGGKKYIDDTAAISLYGIRVGVVEFDDINVKTTLLARGEQWLAANNKIRVSYSITALDLSLLRLDAADFEVYNSHDIENRFLDIEDAARIIKKSIDICDDTKTKVDFGDNFEMLSQTMKRQSDALNLITKDYATNKKLSSEIEKTWTLIAQTEEDIEAKVSSTGGDNASFGWKLTKDGFYLHSKSKEVFKVEENGGKCAGWDMNEDYLGANGAGLVGNAELVGDSAKGGESKVRIFSGLTDRGIKKEIELKTEIAETGFGSSVTSLSHLIVDTNFTINAVIINGTEADPNIDEFDVRVDAITDHELDLEVWLDERTMEKYGFYKSGDDAGFAGGSVVVRVTYNAYLPAFQVLEDGSLIARYAELGGHNIDDILARISECERALGIE